MPATIDTLVEDIYKLFDTDNKVVLKINEEDLKVFAETTVAAVVSSLSKEVREPYLRVSMIGQPDRKIWNALNNVPREKLSAPTLIKFLYGSILENMLILLVKAAGHTIEDPQKEVFISDVKGHHDAIVDGVVVDFKSASDFGFKKFTDGTITTDDPFGYVAQLSAYAHASKSKSNKAGFIAINKVSGEIAYSPLHSVDYINPEARISHIKEILKSPVPPPKCFDAVPEGKAGNMRLATGCHYCDFKFSCWSDSNNGHGLRSFQYANGVKYLTQVNKEPDVPEVHP